jgi:hypothetical protein
VADDGTWVGGLGADDPGDCCIESAVDVVLVDPLQTAVPEESAKIVVAKAQSAKLTSQVW